MRLFGRPKDMGSAPARPLVVALLQGWGCEPANPRLPAPGTKTPAFNRLSQRAAAAAIAPGPAPASLNEALNALAEGRPQQSPKAALDAVLRAPGGISAHDGFQSFVRELNRVGGDCHLLCCLSASGIEGCTSHAAMIAANLAHAGIRVWVHAVLDGRDTPADAGLSAMHDFLEDVAGVEAVRFATVSGRSFALDEAPDTKTRDQKRNQVRDAMADASPQLREGLNTYIDTQNRAGVNDGDIPPGADPAYPGMRSDDALLVLHPQADGFLSLMNALLPGDALEVPSARPALLSACRRMVGWPQSGAVTNAAMRQPILPVQPARPRLLDILRDANLKTVMAAPKHQVPMWAATMEGCTPDASRTLAASSVLEAADAAVRAIKQDDADVIFVLLGGVPAAARSPQPASGTPSASATLPQAARRIIEQQDKGLGRIAAILERRGGTLVAMGTDTSLTPAGALPCLIHGGAIGKDTPLNANASRDDQPPSTAKMAEMADMTATVLALALEHPPAFGGTSLLGSSEGETPEGVNAQAS